MNTTTQSQYVTIWSKSPFTEHWLIERTHTIEYARVLLGLPTLGLNEQINVLGRNYIMLNEGMNPNPIL